MSQPIATEKLLAEISQLRQTLAATQAQVQQLSQQNSALQTELDIITSLEEQTPHETFSQMSEKTEGAANEAQSEYFKALAYYLHKAVQLSQKIGYLREPNKLLKKTVALLRKSFNLYYVQIYLYDEETNALQVHSANPAPVQGDTNLAQAISLDESHNIMAQAAHQRKVILLEDVNDPADFIVTSQHPDTGSVMVIPLQYGRSLLGIVELQHSQPNRFCAAEIDTFTVLAGHIAIGLQNAFLFTERRKIQQKLWYQANLLQNVSDGIIATDNQFRIQSWNKAAEEMYGWKEAEVIGKTMSEVVELTYPEGTREAIVADFLLTGHWKGRVYQRHKNGRQIPVLAAVATIKDEDGHAVGAVAVNRDITDQLKIEDELRERTHALKVRNEDLAQFAYAASHDLQEPLRMITSYLQLVSEQYSEQLDEDASEFIGYAVDGAKRMQQLIKDLLSYSHLGSKEQNFTETDLEQVLKHVLFNLEVQIQEANVDITYDPLPTIKADKTQMMQLLQNLLSNAIKFRKPENAQVHISVKQEEAHWVIQVIDNGIGIEPALTKKIFTIFQRLHTRDEYPGTGIGLAICKKIVQNHQGTISVDSQPQMGTTFSVTIPVDLTTVRG